MTAGRRANPKGWQPGLIFLDYCLKILVGRVGGVKIVLTLDCTYNLLDVKNFMRSPIPFFSYSAGDISVNGKAFVMFGE